MRPAYALVAVLAALVLVPGTASAQPLRTGFVDDALFHFSVPDVQRIWLGRAQRAGATLIRLNVYWNQIAPEDPEAGFVAADPGSAGYQWGALDESIRNAVATGIEPILMVLAAPRWAEGKHRNPAVWVGTWRPQPDEVARFAKALARRYSGHFPDPEHPGSNLPRVRYYQAWNEPNLWFYIAPQFHNGKATSPGIYRRILNSFYGGIKSIDPSDQVLAAGLAPIARPKRTVGPMRFMRMLTCMAGPDHPRRSCHGRIKADIWDAHPYTTGGPTHASYWRNDAQLGDLPQVARLLRGAEDRGHIRGDNRHMPFWVTEFAWDSSPPDPGAVPMWLHKRWTAEALYRMWRAGISTVLWFQLRDNPPPEPPKTWAQTFQCGLYFYARSPIGGRPKPSLRAFRFPFVAFKTPKRVFIWGRTPTSSPGRVVLEGHVPGGWRQIAAVGADANGIFTKLLRTQYRRGSIRARLPDAVSVPFSLRHVRNRFVPPFGGDVAHPGLLRRSSGR
jgi:hypothetical protein